MALSKLLQRVTRLFTALRPEAGPDPDESPTAGATAPAPTRRRREAKPRGAAAAPVVIGRDRHPVSRRSISPNALRVLYRLRDAGFASYLVGGAVRDLLLGLAPKDFDVATDARPEQVRQLFRNCRLIGRRFRLAHIHYGDEIIEVATFRGETEAAGDDQDRQTANGRLLRDNVYGTLEEDIFRRDFTANALYYNIADYSIRDDVGGVADIQSRTLRLIGDPQARFREDPVRMLRAVRFAAKLGFTIEPRAAAALPKLAGLIAEVPPPRLFDEAGKLFLMGHAERSFALLREHGLIAAFMPQVGAALAGPGGAAYAELVRRALAASDERVRAGKPLTSGFLLAVLLWPQAQAAHAILVDQGTEPNLAWQRAADATVGPFCRRVAVPRRISLVSQDIWTLQHWLTQRGKRRVQRVLAHPRFRAAWDFLQLRAEVDPGLAELVAWWRDAQGADDAGLSALVDSAQGRADGEGEGRRRRRRGGRRRRGKVAGGDGSDDA